MNDHNPRIRAQKQQAAENAAMEELDKRSAPLFWAVYLVAFAVVFAIAVDGWQRYKELVAEHEAMVQCIKGQTFNLDGAVLSCHVTDYKLVEGLKS